MPARSAPLSFVIPGRLHPGWSLLGRALRQATGDRLRAEALHIVALTAGVLVWLMGAYAAGTLAAEIALAPLLLWGPLAGAGLLLLLAGLVGFRPRAVVTCGADAVCIARGRERLRLPYAALARPETVAPRPYHRHYRRYAAVHPFLNTLDGPVLLLRTRSGPVAALDLGEADRRALLAHLERKKPPAPRPAFS